MENLSVATFGGGCFWCIEAVIQRLNGVESLKSGYSGGFIKNPPYREVCTGRTGHAEVIQVTFNPDIISYHDLIFIFMTIVLNMCMYMIPNKTAEMMAHSL